MISEKARVLLIDDEKRASAMVRKLELIHKLNIDWARNPRDGFNMVKENQYAVVIFDVMMTFKNGKDLFPSTSNIDDPYGLLTGIRLYKECQKLMDENYSFTSFFCSARRKKVIDGYLKEGADYKKYFRKPFDSSDLYKEIIKYL